MGGEVQFPSCCYDNLSCRTPKIVVGGKKRKESKRKETTSCWEAYGLAYLKTVRSRWEAHRRCAVEKSAAAESSQDVEPSSDKEVLVVSLADPKYLFSFFCRRWTFASALGFHRWQKCHLHHENETRWCWDFIWLLTPDIDNNSTTGSFYGIKGRTLRLDWTFRKYVFYLEYLQAQWFKGLCTGSTTYNWIDLAYIWHNDNNASVALFGRRSTDLLSLGSEADTCVPSGKAFSAVFMVFFDVKMPPGPDKTVATATSTHCL